MNSNIKRRTGRRNVKSGCRTCKIRKVKCDEGRPSCRRCISTGRVCDGYGIWGVERNSHGPGHRKSLPELEEINVIPRPPISSPDDKGYLEWFKCRTVIKLPGTYRSSFWSTLLFQASFTEPAVLHAVLALSSVHKRDIVSTAGRRHMSNNPDPQEQFTIRNYIKSIKAISHLQPSCLTRDRSSFRVALITCVVFVCLEFLRGHFEVAQVHLRNGISILREMQLLSSRIDVTSRLKSCRDSPDDWIVEAFSRLHLQVALFHYTCEPSSLRLQETCYEPPVGIFSGLSDAWKELERQFNGIFHLAFQGRQRAVTGCTLERTMELIGYQQRIQASLSQWLVTWADFKQCRGRVSQEYEKAFQVVHVYHTLATIMADTCLHSTNELVFDSHTIQFLLLIKQLTKLHDIALDKTLPESLMDMSGSVIDLGWIPPLYFVATKCRIRQIRLQAIRLLETTSHREGIWDSKITASIAKKVVEIEERTSFENISTCDYFSSDKLPDYKNMESASLLETYRLHEVEVVLSGAPMDTIQLYCKRETDGVHHRVLLSDYNMRLQCWVDSEDQKDSVQPCVGGAGEVMSISWNT